MKKHPLSGLDADIRDHIERETEDNIGRGMPPAAARAAAMRKFGNVTLVQEDVRAVWIPVWIDQCRQDLRYALRAIRRAPGFSAIAIGSSALGIGACAVIFAIINAALLTPLRVHEPGQLMSISQGDRRTGEVGDDLSYPDYRDLRDTRSFAGVAAYTAVAVSIGTPRDAQRQWGTIATASYFDVVQPRFVAGRGFAAGRDDEPGAPPVVVLSHDLWRVAFASDPNIVGRTTAINGRPATVIGVTAEGFRGTDLGMVSQLWLPLSMIDEDRVHGGEVWTRVRENRQRFWLTVVGRLRSGVEASAAQLEMNVIARQLNAAFREGTDHRHFLVERAGQLNPGLRRMALPLFSVSVAVTMLVLLAACANVANLLLGRAWTRRREIAARMALGASRSRLLRQLLTEALLLASLGGLGGWGIAAYISSLTGLVRTPFGWPLDLSIALDSRVLLFCLGLSVVTALAFGLLPALRATRLDLVADLKTDVRTASAGRLGLRYGLLVGQVAICTVLLLGMGLFLRSLQTARRIDLGLSRPNALLLAFDPGSNHQSDEQARQLLRDITERAERVPGVEAAALTSAVPMNLIVSNSRFVPADKAKDPQATRVVTDIYAVGPQFFALMGIPLLAGEDFAVDRPTVSRPAIVNEAFVSAAFADVSPLGRRVLGDGKALDIVGVVATAKSRTIGEGPRPTIYLPIFSEFTAADGSRGVTLVVKTHGAATAYAEPLRAAIRAVEPSLAVFDVRTFETHLSDALIVPRLAWVLSAVAGSIGVVIAVVGLYGVISFAVIRRRREFGIRLAIGARPGEILRMILRQGLTLALVGIALGCAAALGLTRFSATLLYGVDPRDGVTFVVVPSLLLAVALLACLLPARAAARLDPVDVLRGE